MNQKSFKFRTSFLIYFWIASQNKSFWRPWTLEFVRLAWARCIFVNVRPKLFFSKNIGCVFPKRYLVWSLLASKIVAKCYQHFGFICWWFLITLPSILAHFGAQGASKHQQKSSWDPLWSSLGPQRLPIWPLDLIFGQFWTYFGTCWVYFGSLLGWFCILFCLKIPPSKERH